MKVFKLRKSRFTASWRIPVVHNFCGRGRDDTEVEQLHLSKFSFFLASLGVFLLRLSLLPPSLPPCLASLQRQREIYLPGSNPALCCSGQIQALVLSEMLVGEEAEICSTSVCVLQACLCGCTNKHACLAATLLISLRCWSAAVTTH